MIKLTKEKQYEFSMRYIECSNNKDPDATIKCLNEILEELLVYEPTDFTRSFETACKELILANRESKKVKRD